MCGIVAIKRLKSNEGVAKMVIKRYKNQKARGTEGFGFLAINGNKLTEYIRTENEEAIIAELTKINTSDIIFHHRYPTSTPNLAPTNHPIKVSHNSLKHDYYMVHNGVIWNDKALKVKHDGLGFKYSTEIIKKYESNGNTVWEDKCFNDSEALAIELAMSIDKGGDGIEVIGSIAFVMLQTKKNTSKVVKMFYGRNEGSPLKIEKSKDFIALTSTGAGAIVPINLLFSFDYATLKTEVKPYTVGSEREYVHQNNLAIGYGPYSDYDDIDDSYAPIQARLPVAGVRDSEIEFHWLKGQYDDVQAKLAKIVDSTGPEAERLQEELLDLEDELFPYSNLGYING